MEPLKNQEIVKKMFAQGQPTMVDGQTGYKYSMVAYCPKDNRIASVSRVEREGESFSKVIFRCTSCFNEFEVGDVLECYITETVAVI